MSGFAGAALRRPVTTFMAVVGVLVLGGVSFFSIPMALMPDFSYPKVTVRTRLADASPFEVESLVSKPVEDSLSILNNVIGITSTSSRGMSEVVIKFSWGTNLDLATLDIREKLHQVNLPDHAEAPSILKFDPNSEPVLQIAVICPGLDFVKLREIADGEIKRELLQLPGVAMVTVSGGDEEEMEVLLDDGLLKRHGVDIGQVMTAISGASVNLVGGEVQDGGVRYTVRTLNEAKTEEAVGAVIVKRTGTAFTRVSDLGVVTRSPKRRTRMSRIDGSECVNVAVYRQGDSNIVSVARTVRERLPRISALVKRMGLDKGGSLALTVVSDRSVFIERALMEVIGSGIIGGAVAIAILFLFLGRAVPTLVAGVTIPVSIVAAFNLMYFQGITFNMMSLGGLALGVGMLVDNSIVVLENIYRHMKEGLPAREAAERGAAEMGGAITASTLTNIAVFFPVVFVRGMAGQVFRDLALTVTYSLLASLAVSVTLIPCLVATATRVAAADYRSPRFFSKLLWPLTASLGGLARIFMSAVERASESYSKRAGEMARAPLLPGLFVALLVGAGVWAGSGLGLSLLPEVGQMEIWARIEGPDGFLLGDTARTVERVEGIFKQACGEESEHVISAIGYTTAAGGASDSGEEAENVAEVTVRLKSSEKSAAISAAIEKGLREVPGITFTVGTPRLIELPDPIEIRLTGFDTGILEVLARRASEIASSVDGVVNPQTTVKPGAPEALVTVDRERAAHYGIPVSDIVSAVERKVRGKAAAEFTSGQGKVEIVVRTPSREEGIDGLRNLTVAKAGKAVPLPNVARIEITPGPGRIYRVSGSRVQYVRTGLRDRDLGSAVRELKERLAAVDMPAGYYATVKGRGDEMDETVDSMWLAAALAVILVYIVMASQFESILNPFIIMVTVPFSLAGAALTLRAAGETMNLVAAIGAVMLVGIAVNNGIVLIDTINRLRREEGHELLEAVSAAAGMRLRPILMTTLTTILGLVPMALMKGEGSELRAPMALTVMGGLAFCTLLTMVVIPVLYYLTERARERISAGLGLGRHHRHDLHPVREDSGRPGS